MNWAKRMRAGSGAPGQTLAICGRIVSSAGGDGTQAESDAINSSGNHLFI